MFISIEQIWDNMAIEVLSRLNGTMKTYLLIGDPVEHSLSPIMHNSAFKDLGLNSEYHTFCVKKEDLKATTLKLREIGICGFNVTAPHKEAIMKHLDQIDSNAKEIGAVNTVINKEGKLIGYNTDWIGAKFTLSKKGSIEGKKIIIIGAGGAARAIVYAAKKQGAEVKILNRSLEKAKQLAMQFGVKFGKLEDLDNIKANILINTTPVGLFLNYNETIVTRNQLKNFEIVFDVNYNPLLTKLLRLAKEENKVIISGLDMFVQQGFEAFKIWTGKNPNEKLMSEVVKKSLSE